MAQHTRRTPSVNRALALFSHECQADRRGVPVRTRVVLLRALVLGLIAAIKVAFVLVVLGTSAAVAAGVAAALATLVVARGSRVR